MTLTKEWLLKTIAELEEERDAIPGAVNEDAAMALAAMKLALASLTAEPALTVGDGGDALAYRRMIQSFAPGTKLYTAPPEPVAPAGYRLQPISEYDAMCAAMLQGAAGNSPAIPDGWVACSERMPEESGRYLCCVEDKDGLEKYQWICSWDGENPSSPLWNHYGDWVTHWMELPEDPQQDVNPIGGSATYDFSTDEVVTNPPPERGYVVTCDGDDHFYHNNQEAQKHVMDAINRRSAPVSLVTLEQVPTRLFSEVRKFGYLSVDGAGSGLRVVADYFHFSGGTAPTDKVVDKYLLQGVINYLQEYCDTLSKDDSRVMSIYGKLQETRDA